MSQTKKSESTDRRGKARFAIHREMRYKVLQDTTVLDAGTGNTINMCSGGLLFSVGRDLQPGCFVEVSISWPVLLDNSCPMRLIAFGRVLRSSGGTAACTIDRYEFRTQSRNNIRPIELHRIDSKLVRWATEARKETMKASVAMA